MNAALAPFDYRKHNIGAVEVDGDTWLVALDACRSLGLGDTKSGYMVRRVLAYLSADEKRSVELSGKQTLLVSETGLLKLVGHSLKPFAQEYDRLVRDQALTTVQTVVKEPEVAPPEDPAALVERRHRETRDQLEAQLVDLKAQVEKVERDLEALDRVSILFAAKAPLEDA